MTRSKYMSNCTMTTAVKETENTKRLLLSKATRARWPAAEPCHQLATLGSYAMGPRLPG